MPFADSYSLVVIEVMEYTGFRYAGETINEPDGTKSEQLLKIYQIRLHTQFDRSRAWTFADNSLQL